MKKATKNARTSTVQRRISVAAERLVEAERKRMAAKGAASSTFASALDNILGRIKRGA